jgi:predicted Zn-dependent protease
MPFIRLTAVFMDRAQYDRALVMLEAVMRVSPENPVAKARRAECLLKLGRLAEAKRDYDSLARKFPEESQFQFGLAQIAEKQKDPTLALKYFGSYLRLAPTNSADYAAVLSRVNQLKAGK